MKKATLWSKNFTLITTGTIISAIGGVGTSLAMNAVIFKETGSTFLIGLYSALVLIPQVILPLLIGPYIDKISRKKLIVCLDFLLGGFFLACSVITRGDFFNYGFFIIMGLIINTNSVIYQMAYGALYPELIPEGMRQKGYAVSSMIYPTVNTIILPLATFIFDQYGVSIVFLVEGILLIAAASSETFIQIEENTAKEVKRLDVRSYLLSIKEGFDYLKEEKGLRAIFAYFFFAMFCSEGINILLLPFFENHAVLTLTHYSLLFSIETAGRMMSGFLHYCVKLPSKYKYKIATSVYFIYELLDGMLMFMVYPVMLLARFFLGFLGTNSANIRMSAVQSYITSDKRGRINGISQVLSLGGMLFGRLIAGVLGEYFRYDYIAAIFGIIGAVAVYLIIVKNKESVSYIYNREV